MNGSTQSVLSSCVQWSTDETGARRVQGKEAEHWRGAVVIRTTVPLQLHSAVWQGGWSTQGTALTCWQLLPVHYPQQGLSVYLFLPVETASAVLQQSYRSIHVSGNHKFRSGGFFLTKFYCPCAMPDGSWCIWVREKMLRVLLLTPSPYHSIRRCRGWCYAFKQPFRALIPLVWW